MLLLSTHCTSPSLLQAEEAMARLAAQVATLQPDLLKSQVRKWCGRGCESTLQPDLTKSQVRKWCGRGCESGERMLDLHRSIVEHAG